MNVLRAIAPRRAGGTAESPVRRLAERDARQVARRGALSGLQNLAVFIGPVGVAVIIGRMGSDLSYFRALYQPVAMVNLSVTIGVGTSLQVLTARAVGGDDTASIPRYFVAVLRFCAAVAAAFVVLCLALRGPLAGWLLVPGATRGAFEGFLLDMTLAFPFWLAGEASSAVLRGAGHPGTGTLVSLGQTLLNILVAAALGLGTGLGIYAIPLAAALAGGLEFCWGTALLRRKGLLVGRTGRRVGTAVRQALVRVGLPTAAAAWLLAVVTILLTRLAAPLGTTAVTSLSLGSLVETFCLAPALGYGSAVSILIHQLLGAGDSRRARQVFRTGLRHMTAFYAPLSALMLTGAPRRVAALLSTDPQVVAGVARYLAIVGPAFGATGLVLSASSVLAPLGRGPLALLLNAVYFGAVLAIGAWAIHHCGGLDSLYWTMSCAAAASIVTGLPLICWIVQRSIGSLARDKEIHESASA